MENLSENYGATIKSLPFEVIHMVLEYISCQDIGRFGLTCKDYYELVTSNQSIWKEKYRKEFPNDIYLLAASNGDGDWYSEIKRYYSIKNLVSAGLQLMSPKYYWQSCEVALEELTFFYDIAFHHNKNVYYTINILQNLIRKGNLYLEKNIGKKSHTMTDLYYAKIVLRYLIQICLFVKWFQAQIKKEFFPEILTNFFLQWVDMDNMHCDEDVSDIIKALATKVETTLLRNIPAKESSSNSVQNMCERGTISEQQVLEAISEVIYKEERMTVTSSVDFDLIDIKKVITNKCGNLVVVAAIYKAVARIFGVKCNLIVFPKHLFLQWQSPSGPRNASMYRIDLETGEWRMQRLCPFTYNSNLQCSESSESLLHYLASSYLMTMGAIKNRNIQNAVFLLDFLGPNMNPENPYKSFVPFLLDQRHLPAFDKPFNLKYVSDGFLEILRMLPGLNILYSHYKPTVKSKEVKKRDNRVKYAVGMVCYNREYEYPCVIRDWDPSYVVETGEHLSMELQTVPDQPFYKVTAADQSDRYISQDKLVEASQPIRLYTLEDIIAPEFTHFNGFSYVPNSEKLAEYPNDLLIANMYASRGRASRVDTDLSD